VAVALAGAALAAYQLGTKAFQPPRTDLVWHAVAYEPLQMTVFERGALESANNQDVVCRVKAGAKGSTLSTTIKWVIDDGTPVHRGQLLVELDDSGLQDQLKQQRILLDTAQSAWLQAEEQYKIDISQNESNISQARIALLLAELDLEAYTDGKYPQDLKDIEGRMKMAQSDRDQQLERAAWAERQVKKGYYQASQAQAEVARLQSMEINLKKVEEELRVLNDYTRKRTVADLTSKLEEAKRALERAQQQAAAKEVQSRTDRQTKRSNYHTEKAKYEDIEEEIRKCRIFAPQDGLVVYFVPDQARYGSGSKQTTIAQGEPVSEGQRLMRIPDLRHMLVNTKVHEATVSRVKGEAWQPTGFGDCVRGALLMNFTPLSQVAALYAFDEMRDRFRDLEHILVYPGQKAKIRVEAFPDRVLEGHVKSVATVSSKLDWFSADVKTYQTMVAIDEEVDGLKPDMGAEVTIMLDEQVERGLTVPLQAIFGSVELGKKRKCFVRGAEGQPEEREIEVGLSNDKMAEVKSGLQEGDQVVLNPRALNDKLKTRSPSAADRGPVQAAGGRGAPEGGRTDGMRGPDDKGGPPGRGPGTPDGRRGGPKADPGAKGGPSK
jgi:multidrug efflux pump subunit AcrA (membrane-fusion protein)